MNFRSTILSVLAMVSWMPVACANEPSTRIMVDGFSGRGSYNDLAHKLTRTFSAELSRSVDSRRIQILERDKLGLVTDELELGQQFKRQEIDLAKINRATHIASGEIIAARIVTERFNSQQFGISGTLKRYTVNASVRIIEVQNSRIVAERSVEKTKVVKIKAGHSISETDPYDDLFQQISREMVDVVLAGLN